MSEYTGRKIAIITDVQGLIQPLEAVIAQCKEEGITEIYSLGDNIGDGPNPVELRDTLYIIKEWYASVEQLKNSDIKVNN